MKNSFWNQKTIIAYIALSHHTRFIVPVMDTLKARGATIKYVVGQAERSQEITALAQGLDYCHIFDFIRDEDNEDIRQNYRILRQCVSTSLKSDFLLGIQPITVTDKVLFSTAAEYTGIKNLIEKMAPDLCFALHELNRWGKMMAFWSKKYSIPFITLQEGLSYNLDFGYTGHAQYSTLNLVWGQRVKNKMVGFEAPESKIIPVGNTHLAREIFAQKEGSVREKKREEYSLSEKTVVLLVLSSILPAPQLFEPVFRAVSKSRHHTMFVKFHPACKKLQIDQWIKDIAFEKNLVFIQGQESIYTLLSMADVCVLGQRSTTGLEAVAFGKPLVKLDFAYTPNAPYSFVDQGVARKMSAKEFAKALDEKLDFSRFVDPEKNERFLEKELCDTGNAIETTCDVFKKCIQANRHVHVPISMPEKKSGRKKWSFFIQVPENPDLFLSQLEALAVNSRDQGEYEVIISGPEQKSAAMQTILDSLTGDVAIETFLDMPGSAVSLINRLAQSATGETLVFYEKNLAPLPGWLDSLDRAVSSFQGDKVFGGRICSIDRNIAGGAIVVDHNNTPVPAYQYLDMDFPGVLKQRSFQMVDGFVATSRELFLKTGGFEPNAGQYMFLDYCLKVLQHTCDPDAVVYLPDLKLVFLDRIQPKKSGNDAVFFYSKWCGCLWESQTELHTEDGFSQEDLEQARMAAAVKSV